MIEGLFGPLISALGALRDIEKRPAEARRRFFNDHIAPVQTRMEEVHKDYTDAFLSAIANLKKRTALADIVEVLRAERPKALAKRTDVRTFLQKLLDERLKHRPIRKGEPFLLFYDYVQAIEAYLNAASPLMPGDTWYQHFIDTFSALVAEGKDPFDYDRYGIAGHERTAPDAARVLLERAVRDQMPQAWTQVSDTFGALKAKFLT